jgi:predicted amidophosphoribosyltransferase
VSDENEAQNDLGRFEYECPKCGKALDEYAERCPHCGASLSEAYSGVFRPKRSKVTRLLITLVLVVFLVSLVLLFVISLRALIRGS